MVCAEDLQAYRSDFRKACRKAGSEAPSSEKQSLQPLIEPLRSSRHNELSRQHVLDLAEQEAGFTLFDVRDLGSVSKAAEYFKANGFVVLSDAVASSHLAELRSMCCDLMRVALEEAPEGNWQSKRFCLQRTTMVKPCLEVADNLAVSGVLQKLWRGADFCIQCTSGDFALPGAKEQALRSDSRMSSKWNDAYSHYDEVPAVKAYVALVDFDETTSPLRVVPGSHRSSADESRNGSTSIKAYCPQGSVILLDQRVQYGFSANSSSIVAPMLSVLYASPSFGENRSAKDDLPHRGSSKGCHQATYHRVLCEQKLAELPDDLQSLCRNLVKPSVAEKVVIGSRGRPCQIKKQRNGKALPRSQDHLPAKGKERSEFKKRFLRSCLPVMNILRNHPGVEAAFKALRLKRSQRKTKKPLQTQQIQQPVLRSRFDKDQETVVLTAKEHSQEVIIVEGGAAVVRRAFYGDPNNLWDLSKGFDVTDEVIDILGTRCLLKATNKLFGEPLRFKRKTLAIEVVVGRAK